MVRRRGFGEVERRSGPAGVTYRARYTMPDGTRYSRTVGKADRPDLTVHHLRHTAPTLAGQHGATAAELQARAGHASLAAMVIYQHATLDRDKALAERIGATYDAWAKQRD